MKKRNGEIDLLKFLFACMIVLFHSKNFTDYSGQGYFQAGSIGVSFFFIVSGYLLVRSSSKISIKESIRGGGETASATVRFIWNKIKGLCPDYYVAFVIAFIVENYVHWSGSFLKVIKNGVYSIFELLFLTQSGMVGKGAFRSNHVTWYLSAMLIVMAIYFPLLICKKTRKPFLTLGAPLLSLFIFGYAYSTFDKGFSGPSTYVGIMTKGLMRGFAEIALGCVCFTLAERLRKINATRLFQWLLSIISLGSYAFVFYCATLKSKTPLNAIMTIAIAMGVIISFSGQTIWNQLLSSPIISWLGIFSFDLYLSHGFWSHAMRKIFPAMPYQKLLLIYLLFVLLTSLAVYWISKGIRKAWPTVTARFKSLMILEDTTKSQGQR